MASQPGKTKDTSLQMTNAEIGDRFASVKGIIFDIDGTLADSWKLGFDATVVVLKNNNIPTITEEIYHQGTRYSTPDRLARHAGLEPGDADYQEVGNRLGAEFDNLYVDLVDTQTAGFYKGIEQMLLDVPSTVSFGALTNACVDYAYAVFQANLPEGSPLEDRFLSIKGADNVPAPKPNPDGLYEVCKEMKLSPEDCVYIGDSPSDAAAADAAGMPSIGVMWGSHSEESLKKSKFTHLCSTVDELRMALNLGVLQQK